MGEPQTEPVEQKKGIKLPVLGAIAALVVVAVAIMVFQGAPGENPVGLISNAPGENPVGLISATAPMEQGTGTLDEEQLSPSQYAVRQRYFEEVFKPKRDQYGLFEKAAAYLNIPLKEVPEYFGLNSEEEIFADLSTPAEDFSEIAYLFAIGKYFTIGFLDEEYYKQPEFYLNFKEQGLRYWAEPDPKYWVPHGYGSYPSEQWTTLKKGGGEEFTGVVFFYSNWGVQTFQGVTLMPTTESQKYFDIEITPQNFLTEPTFPKFYLNWVHRIVITGKPKPDIPAGEYIIGINVQKPPLELVKKWELDYKNIYFDAVSGVKPEGNQIEFTINVTE